MFAAMRKLGDRPGFRALTSELPSLIMGEPGATPQRLSSGRFFVALPLMVCAT
jgi:hypothetical protein